MAKTHSLDMTQGSVIKKLLQFAMPILLSSILQHLYTIADRIVVGNFAQNGALALAAVGSTSAATNLLLNLFTGLSVGVNVVCANLRGANQTQRLRDGMHTAILVALFSGIFLSVFGAVLSESILTLMSTPENVLTPATTYMQIIFLGVPASIIYNFSAAILRSHGDAQRSMYILGITGIINVVLNLVLVVFFHMGVEGVAIATIASQYLSAITVLWILFSPRKEYKLRWKELRIHSPLLLKIIAIGLPCGISGILQNLSNVILQSSVNSFNDPNIIAGNTAATDITQFSYLVMAAFSSACVSFSGQCCGAKEYKRLDKLVVSAVLSCLSIMTCIGILVTIFPIQLLKIFNPDPAVAQAGVYKLLICSWGALLYSISDTMVGCVRGMGKSTSPMIINLLSLCGIRVLWVLLIFPLCRNIWFLFMCYPISWAVSAVAQTALLFYYRKKLLANAAVK